MSRNWRLLWALTFLASLISDRGCLGEQRFSETPPIYQEISSGEDVKLRCKVADKRGQCIWQKDRKPIGMHPDKYEWTGGGDRDGDCTLLIRRASLDFDDGYWECQVTPGDFTRQDALTSLPSRLLVRVKPRKPRLEYGGTGLSGALTLREGQEVTISCVSRYGNPPAVIKWFIGGDEIEPLREQTNATEVDNPKTWAAHSLLRIRANRENHGLPIRCLSLHATSPLPAIAESRLDIHYSPEVRIETSPRLLPGGLEDSSSFMSIKCIADANPPATIKWYKDSSAINQPDGNVEESSNYQQQNRTHHNATLVGSEVRFEPVKREDIGLYTCRAFNVMGESSPANYRLDVQYGPRLVMTEKNSNATTGDETEFVAMLGASVEPFTCAEFEANPTPRYRWVHHRVGIPETIENPLAATDALRGRRLGIRNVVWSDEGEYRCVAYNVINGVRREMPSDTRFMLHVSGPPEIQTGRSSTSDGDSYESVGWMGEPVHRLESRFCSRPPPRLVAWQWGSSHVRAGESINPKYEALPLEPITENKVVTNCYRAKLEIRDLQKEDARIYTLLIESEKGKDSTSIRLKVRDPTEIRIVAIAAAVGLLLVIVLVAAGFYAILRLRQRRYERNNKEVVTTDEEEEGSIAADAFYTTPASVDHRQKAPTPCTKSYTRKVQQPDGGLAVMYDYDQIGKQTRAMSPEALKVRRAPAVLQAPTIV